MIPLLRFLCVACAILFSTCASALDYIEFTFTVPDSRDDGTPLLASEITGYSVFCSIDPQSLTNCAEIAANVKQPVHVRVPSPGKYFISMTTHTATEESLHSNPANGASIHVLAVPS